MDASIAPTHTVAAAAMNERSHETPFDDAAVAARTAAMVAGDRDAYADLFRERCGFVESEAARRLHRRRDLIDDVVQESWLRIARGPRQCPAVASLDAWLRRIVRSSAMDLLRSELARRCREERVAASRQEARVFLDDVALLDELRSEAADIAGLSAEERALFELKVRTNATIGQLAAWLGVGRAAMDSMLRRAAERARAALDGRDAKDADGQPDQPDQQAKPDQPRRTEGRTKR
jgi:RNA polymerase sigma factor (sigma-70 family)